MDVSDQPIVVKQGFTEIGGMEQFIRRTYTPPLDGEADNFKAFDQWLARRVAEMLVSEFPGYMWKVLTDGRQGVVAFSIPPLMGPTLHYVINLAEYRELTPRLLRHCGGELLERIGLRRSRANAADVRHAKANKHRFDFADLSLRG